jgi:hypothetical protein
MRTLFAVLMACGLLVSFMGCCLHDTCDCCSDICGGCCSNGGYYTAPAGPAVKAEEIKKLPLPKDAGAPVKIEKE